jgi:sarcosine oxidase subunit alpha
MSMDLTSPNQPNRRPKGGAIDRSRPLRFTVDGTSLTGFAGDTLASALVANGRLRVGDSIYLRRPRGIMTAGVEEPNAFVRVNGAHNESMLPATTLELTEGLDVTLLDGIGVLDGRPDPAEYDKMHVHTDVAVIGAGPAGLAAARAASATGARVMLFEQDFALGGSLLSDRTAMVEGRPGAEWVAGVRDELEASPETTVLTRTCVFGSYDNNYLIAVEQRPEHTTRDGVSRQRVWHVSARQVVLAVGAFERPIVFADNDVPGIMLASAARAYADRWGAVPGQNVVVFTTNDSAYEAAHALAHAGAEVTVVDAREAMTAPSSAQQGALRAGMAVHTSSAVTSVDGHRAHRRRRAARGRGADPRVRRRGRFRRLDAQRQPAQPAAGPVAVGRRAGRFRAIGRGPQPARGRRRKRQLLHAGLPRRRRTGRARRGGRRGLPRTG